MAHRFVIAACQGRMCAALGGDALAVALAAEVRATLPSGGAPCTLIRGGCYGLCELAPNVVVRRLDSAARQDEGADRLTLTHAKNETVYSIVTHADAHGLVASHLLHDTAYGPATRMQREAALPPKGDVAARIRALRARRAPQCPPE